MIVRKTNACSPTWLFLVLVVVAGVAQATPRPDGEVPASSREKRVEKAFDVRERAVALASSAADISVSVTSGDRAELVVDLEYWSNDEDWMDTVEREFDVEMRESPNRVLLELPELPNLEHAGWLKRLVKRQETFYSLSVSLQLPKGTDLEIDNRYGDVEVNDVAGALDLVNSSGTVAVNGARGEVSIENSYGDVELSQAEGHAIVVVTSGKARVSRVTGDTTVSNRYGEVVVEDIDGQLDVDSSSSKIEVRSVTGPAVIVGSYADARVEDIGGDLRLEVSSGSIVLAHVEGRADIGAAYGTVQIEDIGADLVLRSSSGEVEASDVGGSVRIENSYGPVVLEDIEGDIEVNNPSGGVTIETAGGDATVRSSYEVVRVRDLAGDLSITATSSGVTADEIDGGVAVTTSYAGVEIEGVGGQIDIRNQSGRVEVQGLRGKALLSQNRVETSYADIDFSWPADGNSLSFTLEATYGDIRSDFPATSRKHGSRANAEGSYGAGEGTAAASLTLTARNGSIFLRQE